MNDFLEPLSSIKPTEAPPFLLTRIREKIFIKKNDSLSPTTAWALGISLLIVAGINIALITDLSHKNTNNTENMYIYSNNSLYSNE